MIIDFSKMNESVLKNFKGGEKEFRAKMFDTDGGKIMLSRLVKGASIGCHTHENNCEIIYILSGSGKALYDGAEERVSEGMCHFCPEGHSHSLINDGEGDLVFFAAVINTEG